MTQVSRKDTIRTIKEETAGSQSFTSSLGPTEPDLALIEASESSDTEQEEDQKARAVVSSSTLQGRGSLNEKNTPKKNEAADLSKRFAEAIRKKIREMSVETKSP
jgi:hypothetical protein